MVAVAVAILVASSLLHVPLFAARSAALVPFVMVVILSVPPGAAAMMMLLVLFVLLYPTATVMTA